MSRAYEGVWVVKYLIVAEIAIFMDYIPIRFNSV